ncbi:MAG TPA: energy transducer TonB [Bacteroidota bacterium]|nr:energy transducer TonB [Bacteroidota bacterium]
MKTIVALLLLTALTAMSQEQQTPQPEPTAAVSSISAPLVAEGTPQQSGKQPSSDYLPVDKQPVPLKGHTPWPAYPDSARRAGIEGMTYVKIWIDEQGNPHQAEVIKTENAIFNQPSIDAAMQWKFKPAILKDKPVAVWITIPFKFKLAHEPKPDGKNAAPTPMKKPGTR